MISINREYEMLIILILSKMNCKLSYTGHSRPLQSRKLQRQKLRFPSSTNIFYAWLQIIYCPIITRDNFINNWSPKEQMHLVLSNNEKKHQTSHSKITIMLSSSSRPYVNSSRCKSKKIKQLREADRSKMMEKIRKRKTNRRFF